MKLKTYVNFWMFFSVILAWEYFGLNRNTSLTILSRLVPEGFDLSPIPGHKISLALGWAGISTMLFTNLYILKKRVGIFKNFGPPLSRWLNFHIFCGLMGPTFIFFHSNFKVRGLVAISFWSMVVSFLSGIVGRYIYVQLLHDHSELDGTSVKWAAKLSEYQKLKPDKVSIEELERLKTSALIFVGVPKEIIVSPTANVGVLSTMFKALVGDVRRYLQQPQTSPHLPSQSAYAFEQFAVFKRKAVMLGTFQRLMGYWHAFHMPFAVFMYVVAIIHIAVALAFGVH